MSLSKSRILKNSVSFSNESYQLTYNSFNETGQTEEAAEINQGWRELEAERGRLEQEKQQLQELQQLLARQQEELQQEFARVIQMKQSVEEHAKQREQELEAQKQEMLYQFADALWDNALQLAEKVVGQAIDTRQISMLTMLKRTVETLPVAFEKLVITVHPETYEWLKGEQAETKEYWLLELVEWKFDFSLKPGEFIVEEQKEYFQYRFKEIFERLREQWQDQKDFEER
ncbi:FliH/SctL family protein [Ectobacillus ponti]|uniref:FliH/SctL family protein n=1 Tax=Ectobacillus ponti TaxID=2961894 RepID=A0AA42BPY3_9BACI|nr:FliH/SctL family protein [Ectobacillus ponti]MCP8968846.1 FliH/SctL family protein [Ectobacillus ponti]